MKRTVITVDSNGRLSIPSNLEDLWMSESELIDMLYITAPKLNAVIRAIYKEGMLSMSEVHEGKNFPRVFGKRCMDSLWLLPFASV